ncbi:MAG: hypothetical protein HYX94_09325 [Chloroflexi bacterium]|nr:hypothetical protein [Chloroflexota bacterium]
MANELAERLSIPRWLDDVAIEEAPVPRALDGARAAGVLWQAAPGRFLLHVPEVARYLVEGGERITVDPAPQASEAEVQRFLRLTPLAALLFQRGLLAFHAAAVVPPAVRGQWPVVSPPAPEASRLTTDHGSPITDHWLPTPKAVLLAGDSGAGKSTLLAALLKRGWSLLADDLAVVGMDETGAPLVFPTFPEVRLWPDALAKLGLAGGEDAGVVPARPPFPVSPCPPLFPSPLPLRAFVCLGTNSREDFALTPLAGGDRFDAILDLTYNTHVADALLHRGRCLAVAAAMAGAAPVFRLLRPRRWCVEEMADQIERELA